MNIKFSEETVSYFGQETIDKAMSAIRNKFGDIECYIPIDISIGSTLVTNGKPIFNMAGSTSLNRTAFFGNSIFIKVQLSKIFLVDTKLGYNTLLHELFHAVEMSSLRIQIWYNEATKEVYIKDLVGEESVSLSKKYYRSVKFHDSQAFEKRAIQFAEDNSSKRSLTEKVVGSWKILKMTIKQSMHFTGIHFNMFDETAFTSDTAINSLLSKPLFKL